MSKWDDSRAARFAANVAAQPNGCVVWLGAKTRHGYGQIRIRGKRVYAHRFAYDQAHPDAVLTADQIVRHSCDTPACVSPAHLIAGTQKDNMQDAAQKGRVWSPTMGMTTCRKGHPIISGIKCRPCANERQRQYSARQRANTLTATMSATVVDDHELEPEASE